MNEYGALIIEGNLLERKYSIGAACVSSANARNLIYRRRPSLIITVVFTDLSEGWCSLTSESRVH